MERTYNRRPDELRPVRIQPGVLRHAEGSALIEMGDTHVLCAASVEQTIPSWLRERGQGWVTAEYAMLPRSTLTRTRRERPSPSGRSHEIQRLIGRALRLSIDLVALGEYSIIVDCDVLQADGGTRTAAITGGYVALVMALHRMQADSLIPDIPIRSPVAAVSVGIVNGVPLLDLDYGEDSMADVDCNVVQNEHGEFVEVQATAENTPLTHAQLNELLALANTGIRTLLAAQHNILNTMYPYNM